ncbi:MAG: DUF362 domain-containing protein [Bryobacteraceae bacterium]
MFTRRSWMTSVGGMWGAALQAQRGNETVTAPEATELAPVVPNEKRSLVTVRTGEERRRIVREALEGIDSQIRTGWKGKKYVLIKPNNVSTQNQLASTHVDTLRGILDYLDGRWKGEVIIAESSAGQTMEGFENFLYPRLPGEYKRLRVKLIDLNTEGEYKLTHLLTPDLHVQPVRLAARMLDPESYQICSAILKTHNTVIGTLSVKNMTLGAPIHYKPGETPRWNDKRKYHGGVRQTHYNMFLTAAKLRPYWGATLIDGWEGMEGNGPASGTPVPSRAAVASTDYIAADRVGLELMGIDASWIAYLRYCHQNAVGQYDLTKIDVDGPRLDTVAKKYRLHKDVERELEWMGPMKDLPPKLG